MKASIFDRGDCLLTLLQPNITKKENRAPTMSLLDLQTAIQQAYDLLSEFLQDCRLDSTVKCVIAGGSVRDLCLALARESLLDKPGIISYNDMPEAYCPKDIDVYLIGLPTLTERITVSDKLFPWMDGHFDAAVADESYDRELCTVLPYFRPSFGKHLSSSTKREYKSVIPLQVILHKAKTAEELIGFFDLKNAQFAYVGGPNTMAGGRVFSDDILSPGWEVVSTGEVAVNYEGILSNPLNTIHRLFKYIDKYGLPERAISAKDIATLSILHTNKIAFENRG